MPEASEILNFLLVSVAGFCATVSTVKMKKALKGDTNPARWL